MTLQVTVLVHKGKMGMPDALSVEVCSHVDLQFLKILSMKRALRKSFLEIKYHLRCRSQVVSDVMLQDIVLACVLSPITPKHASL